MIKHSLQLISGFALTVFCFYACSGDKPAEQAAATTAAVEKPNFGGYESQVKWGEHLVLIGGCTDCHTPKKMTPMGPADDSTLFLSGHPEKLPPPDVDRKQAETKGIVVTADFTSWVGPWGITYSANLTPDPTGTGNWTEEQFVYSLRNNMSKGLPASRHLLPPMSMMPVKEMTDDELKAIFAYLRTIKPIKNISVQPTAPVL
ncbi:MAG: c-type cytochrome, partial [Chitinophagales bacterium]